MDVRNEDEVRRLGLGKIGKVRNRINNDNGSTALELNAGMPESSDHNVAAGSRHARRRWYLSQHRDRHHKHQ